MGKIRYSKCDNCSIDYSDTPHTTWDVSYGKFCSFKCRKKFKEDNPLKCPDYHHIDVNNLFNGKWNIVAFNSSQDGFRTIARYATFKQRRSNGHRFFIVTSNVKLPSDSVDNVVNAFMLGKFKKMSFED